GREAGAQLAQRAASFGWRVDKLDAPDGTDWNDYLREGKRQ
ncbi:MAG TPA: virulence-associated protein E, partial [Lentisphaeria bacterium]|nr:virulence-associated protein E [Lentisphaeria bacterium]